MDRKIINVYDRDEKIYVDLEDGSVLSFPNTEDNLKNIDLLLDEQLKDKINELDRELNKEEEVTGLDAGLSLLGFASGFTTVCSSVLTCGMLLVDSNNELTIPFGSIACVSLITYGTIKTYFNFKDKSEKKKNNSIKKELEKLEYLSDNSSVLKSYDNYTNSLSGIEYSKRELIDNSCLPFTIVDSNSFDIDDYEKIVDNINYEKSIVKNKKKKMED